MEVARIKRNTSWLLRMVVEVGGNGRVINSVPTGIAKSVELYHAEHHEVGKPIVVDPISDNVFANAIVHANAVEH
jgi:hypothetical protein